MKEIGQKVQDNCDFESMDKLFKEADAIINNSSDEKLKNIWNKIINWKDDESEEEKYYQQFIRVMTAMSLLNFSERMPYLNNGKTLLNLISHTINHVNEELQDKIFPIDLLSLVLAEFEMNNVVVILTDYDGNINYYYPGFAKFPVNLTGVNIDSLFENSRAFEELKMYQPEEGIVTKMKYLPGKKVRVKAKSSRLKFSEGVAYIIQLCE